MLGTANEKRRSKLYNGYHKGQTRYSILKCQCISREMINQWVMPSCGLMHSAQRELHELELLEEHKKKDIKKVGNTYVHKFMPECN